MRLFGFRGFLRLLPLLGVGFAAACSLPSRDNPYDSNLRPTARVAVTLGTSGEQVVSGERWQVLYVDVTGTSVASGEVTRVDIERLDGRDEGTAACPLSAPRFIGSIDPGANPPAARDNLLWDDHADVCFEFDEPTGRTIMPLRIKATAHTSRGAKDSATVEFRLVNGRPQIDPGPALWVDPLWGTTVQLSNGRNEDPDGDSLSHSWEQVAGPPVTITSSGLASFPVDLAGDDSDPTSRYGLSYRFEVRSCDAWECGDPRLAEVYLRPAVWAATGNGLTLLDGTFTSATRFDDDVSDTVPITLTATFYSLAPAPDGLFLFQEANTVARHLRGDFTAVAMPVLPAIFQEVAGTSTFGVAWVMVGPGPGPYQILEVGPGESFTPLADVNSLFAQTMLSRTHIARHGPSTPLWAAGYEAGHFRMSVFHEDGGIVELEVFSGEPLYEDCLGDEEIDTIAADPDGGLWVVGGYGILRLDDGAAVVDCFPIEDSVNSDNRKSAVVVPAADGGSQLLYIGQPSSFGIDASLRSMRMDGIERIYPDVTPSLIGYDPSGERLLVVSADGVGTYDLFSDLSDPVAFIPMSEIFPGISMTNQAFESVTDAAGRLWLLRRDLSAGGDPKQIVRLPEGLRLVRATIEEAGAIDAAAQAAVDPRSGRVWVTEKIFGGGWRVAQYDERGFVPETEVPLPMVGSTASPFYDGVRVVRFDPGAADGSRSPGLWVLYNSNADGGGMEFRVVRLSLDGSVEASFGGPGEEPAGGFPDNGIALYYGATAVIDPFDGSLWVSVHDDDLGDQRLGEVYRLRDDGSLLRHGTVSTQVDLPNYSTAANVGGILVAPGNVLHLVRATEASIASQVACFGGDEAASAGYDAGVDEAILFCWAGGAPSYVTRWDVRTGLDIHSLRSPSVPFAVVPLFGYHNGRQDAVTGTYWSPEEFGVRQYDRFLFDAGLYPVPAKIRFMIQ